MEHVVDMKNYIRSRQESGKTAAEIIYDLQQHGYDHQAAHGLVLKYWDFGDK